MVTVDSDIMGSERKLPNGYHAYINATWESWNKEFNGDAITYSAILYKGNKFVDTYDLGTYKGGGDTTEGEIDSKHKTAVMKNYEKTIHRWEKNLTKSTNIDRNDDGRCPPGYEYIREYHKKDGTFVRGHCSKKPDH